MHLIIYKLSLTYYQHPAVERAQGVESETWLRVLALHLLQSWVNCWEIPPHMLQDFSASFPLIPPSVEREDADTTPWPSSSC